LKIDLLFAISGFAALIVVVNCEEEIAEKIGFAGNFAGRAKVSGIDCMKHGEKVS
jgi:hypothetical protein